VRRGVLSVLAAGLGTGAAIRLPWSVGQLVAALAVALVAVAVVTGLLMLVRAVARRRDRVLGRYRETRRRLAPDLRLAIVWVLVGAGLTGLAVAGLAVGWLALLGAVLLFGLCARALVSGLVTAEAEARRGITGAGTRLATSGRIRRLRRRAPRAPRLPLSPLLELVFGHPRPVGKISAYLEYTLAAGFLASFLFLGVAVASLVVPVPGEPPGRPDGRESKHRRADRGETDRGALSGSLPTAAADRPTYEELCPELPDPLAIGYGLGGLFRRDGAVEAGCGEPDELVLAAGSVRVSAGYCGSELRSLAVVAEGHPPVLLYGAAARFAAARASLGQLLYAEEAAPGGGELYVVATTDGTYVFVRLALDAGVGGALRCDEITPIAEPFAKLPPPLVELWRQRMMATGAWLWPLPDPAAGPRAFVFVAHGGSAVVAHGDCVDDGDCALDGETGEVVWRGSAVVSVADLAPWMPAPQPGG